MAAVPVAASDASPKPTELPVSVASAENPWAPLLQTGVQLLQALASAHETSDKPAAHSLVQADPTTGNAICDCRYPSRT